MAWHGRLTGSGDWSQGPARGRPCVGASTGRAAGPHKPCSPWHQGKETPPLLLAHPACQTGRAQPEDLGIRYARGWGWKSRARTRIIPRAAGATHLRFCKAVRCLSRPGRAHLRTHVRHGPPIAVPLCFAVVAKWQVFGCGFGLVCVSCVALLFLAVAPFPFAALGRLDPQLVSNRGCVETSWSSAPLPGAQARLPDGRGGPANFPASPCSQGARPPAC